MLTVLELYHLAGRMTRPNKSAKLAIACNQLRPLLGYTLDDFYILKFNELLN